VNPHVEDADAYAGGLRWQQHLGHDGLQRWCRQDRRRGHVQYPSGRRRDRPGEERHVPDRRGEHLQDGRHRERLIKADD
jgi:hypothetical protein